MLGHLRAGMVEGGVAACRSQKGCRLDQPGVSAPPPPPYCARVEGRGSRLAHSQLWRYTTTGGGESGSEGGGGKRRGRDHSPTMESVTMGGGGRAKHHRNQKPEIFTARPLGVGPGNKECPWVRRRRWASLAGGHTPRACGVECRILSSQKQIHY